MRIIEAVDICQSFSGKDIIKNINLKVDKGEVFALIGPTGSGKTTLLRIFDLIDKPSSGKLYFEGDEVRLSGDSRLSVRRKMAYVQQKPAVFNMSVFENVSCGLVWRGEKTHNIERKTGRVLELVAMSDFRNRNARTLSGGEMQRIALARSLLTEPEILFLDEPTANLDPVSTTKIEEVLAHIIKEKKTTVVMTTHDMSQGQRMADRVGVLIGGQLMQVGSPNEIFNMPRNRQVAEFVGAENILGGVVTEKQGDLAVIRIIGREIYAITGYQEGESVYVLIRPEYVTLAISTDGSSARNVLEGKIVKINTLGPVVRIEIDCGFPLLALVTVQAAEELKLSLGKNIFASFKATALDVIKRWN